MSTDEEIQEVYLSDLSRQYKQVRQKYGIEVLLDGLDGYHVEDLYGGFTEGDVKYWMKKTRPKLADKNK